MPTISFPSNPSPNDTYSFNGKTWIYNGSAWDLQSSGAINDIPIGNVTPASGAFTTLSSIGATVLGEIAGDLVPSANAFYNLGSNTKQWSNLYLSGNTIFLGDLQLKDTGNNTLGVFAVNGSTLANIAVEVPAGNIIGTVPTAEYVTQNAQANITSVGTLTSLSVTGNISTDQYFIGNGSQLTGIAAGGGSTTVASTPPESPNQGDVWIDTNTGTQFIYFNDGNSSQWAEMEAEQSFYYSYTSTNEPGGSAGQVQYNTGEGFGGSANLTFDGTTLTAAAISSTSIAGTLTTASQPNITSIGTLTSLTVNGTATYTGNIDVSGNINVTGNLNYQNVTDLVVGDPLIYLGANTVGDVDDLGFVVNWTRSPTGYQHGGLVRDASDQVWKLFGNVVAEPTTTVDFTNAVYQPLQVGNLSAVGNITGSNLVTNGSISATGNITGGNLSVTSSIAAGTTISATGNITGGNIVSSGSVTGSTITATGNITAGNVSVTTNLSANVITENSARVATMGKAIAMSIVFGG